MMPAVFLGHGNPMNALENNAWTQAWARIGATLPRPKAILCVSAHWYVSGTAVTAQREPRTIHDFGGFPRELYEIRYPAPGAPELASRVAELLDPVPVQMDHGWGLDHGAWSVLAHVYPKADIPVVQLSIDQTKVPDWHYQTAKTLAPLRNEGVLIMGSGNIVHNLHRYSWRRHPVQPYDWAVNFETAVRAMLSKGDFAGLVAYQALGHDAALSVPTPDHYLPLLYVLAQAQPHDVVSFPVEGFDGGSISMLGVQVG